VSDKQSAGDEARLRAFPSHQSRQDIKTQLGNNLKWLTWNVFLQSPFQQ